MYIIIDGYNVLKNIHKTTYVSDREKQEFIAMMVLYAKIRKNQVIIVFDAGPDFAPTSKRTGIVVVQYAGQQQSADDYIVHYIDKNRERDLLVVSDDNELGSRVACYGVEVIGVYDFYYLCAAILQEYDTLKKNTHNQIYKTTSLEYDDIDELMNEGADKIDAHYKEEEIFDKRMRPSSRLSKKEKKLEQKKLKI